MAHGNRRKCKCCLKLFRPGRKIPQPPRTGPVKAGRVFAATRRDWP